MDKKEVRNWQIGVTIFSIIFGTLLHFLYEWSNENQIIALFSAVNESTWEHLKLVFFPMLVAGIVEYFALRGKTKNMIQAKAVAIVFAICFIIVFFYTYTGINGTNFFILDILSFLLSIIIGEWIAYKIIINKSLYENKNKIFAIIILTILLISFMLFTFNPPKINLFKDPITNEYGIIQK